MYVMDRHKVRENIIPATNVWRGVKMAKLLLLKFTHSHYTPLIRFNLTELDKQIEGSMVASLSHCGKLW